MATAQLQRNQTKNWEAIFPNEQLTEQKSALFMKKLLAVGVSNLTYLRNLFPENAYGDKCLDDLHLKILRDQSSCPGASQVIQWVKGTFDAMDKKYLKSLVIGIYMDDKRPETVIESYTFKFSYHQKNGGMDLYRNDAKVASAYSAEETKKETIKLLRNLIVLTSAMGALPENCMMTMKLFYYDEVTPADYEPPGFRAASGDQFVFNEEATNIAVGEASTAFHTLKLRVKTQSKYFECEEENNALDVNMADETSETAICDASLDNEALSQNTNIDDEAFQRPPPASMQQSMDANAMDGQVNEEDAATAEEEEQFKVRCPCGCNEDDGLMIRCCNCKFWQHAVCFVITNEVKAPENHICDICAQQGNLDHEPTDPSLLGMTSIAIQATCLWRRALSVCSEFKQVVAPQLARRLSIEVSVAQGLINRLEKEGFVGPMAGKKKKQGKKVNHQKIEKEGIPLYLRTPRKQSIELIPQQDEQIEDVERLVDSTNKINLNESKKSARSLNFEQQIPMATDKTDNAKDSLARNRRKRARSKTTCSEFDICASQESSSTKKNKASTVNKDIRT